MLIVHIRFSSAFGLWGAWVSPVPVQESNSKPLKAGVLGLNLMTGFFSERQVSRGKFTSGFFS